MFRGWDQINYYETRFIGSMVTKLKWDKIMKV